MNGMTQLSSKLEKALHERFPHYSAAERAEAACNLRALSHHVVAQYMKDVRDREEDSVLTNTQLHDTMKPHDS